MLKNIDKIYAFLVIYETKSFSKAAQKLNISQPAITQKIKQLEKFLDASLIERKKNGIILTKKGKYFLEIAKNLQHCINNAEIKIQNLKKESIPITIGASSTVGNHILPKYLSSIKEILNKNINVTIKDNFTLIKQLAENKLDFIFTTITSNNSNIIFTPLWKDKIVFFSNKPLPKTMDLTELKHYDFICRENNSTIRQAVSKILQKHNFSCDILNIKSYVDNSTTLKLTIMNATNQFLSISSLSMIEEEVKQNKLFITKINNINLERTIYLAYLQDAQKPFIKIITTYLSKITF
jgi:DNA-binding transcriptional LysR family regulator